MWPKLKSELNSSYLCDKKTTRHLPGGGDNVAKHGDHMMMSLPFEVCTTDRPLTFNTLLLHNMKEIFVEFSGDWLDRCGRVCGGHVGWRWRGFVFCVVKKSLLPRQKWREKPLRTRSLSTELKTWLKHTASAVMGREIYLSVFFSYWEINTVYICLFLKYS